MLEPFDPESSELNIRIWPLLARLNNVSHISYEQFGGEMRWKSLQTLHLPWKPSRMGPNGEVISVSYLEAIPNAVIKASLRPFINE